MRTCGEGGPNLPGDIATGWEKRDKNTSREVWDFSIQKYSF